MPTIIQGNFTPPKNARILNSSARLFSLLLGGLFLAALISYGVKVQFEDDINQLAKRTRDLNEQNKELQVKLNHIRSYKNVEAAAGKVPHLHAPETVIEVPAKLNSSLPRMPKQTEEFPHVYGY